MRHSRWILIAILLLPGASGAQALPDNPQPAQPAASGWNRVADLAHDEEIVVARTGGRDLRCRFAGATDDYLFCDASNPWLGDRSLRFDRAEVGAVRLNQESLNRHILVGVGAAAGLAYFLSHTRNLDGTPSKDNGTRVMSGLLGAGIGAGAGYILAIPIAPFIPGKLIYRHPAENEGRFSLKRAPRP
jgi:hypothetical protein